MKKLLPIIAAIVNMSETIYADEDTFLLGGADVRGMKDFADGPRIVIESPDGSILNVKVWAFGKEFQIPESELAKIKGRVYSTVSISGMSAMKATGGPKVFFILKSVGMFGGDSSKNDPILKQEITIIAQENSPIEVTVIRSKIP